jgi:phosphate transport system protein
MTDHTAMTEPALTGTAAPADHTARTEHTARAFDSDLQELRRKVAEMGDLAMKQIVDSVRALLERDAELAERVIATDPTIDAMRQEIEQKAVLTIARRQPVAVDLREIIAAMRMCNDLERVGDHAKHIGKRVIALRGDLYPQGFARGVEHMANLVLSSLKQVLDAYTSHDLQATLAVWTGDEEVDALCTLRFRELLTYMMEDPRNITFCMHLMFCANDLERIGDHATNIAETVYYMIDGGEIADQRPQGDPTNFPSVLMQKKN